MNKNYDKPFARGYGNFRYLPEEQYGKTLKQIYIDKDESKARSTASRMEAERLAKLYVSKYTDAMDKLRKGEIDPVSVLLLKEEITKDYYERASQLEGISKFDIEYIWDNTWKSEKKKWFV